MPSLTQHLHPFIARSAPLRALFITSLAGGLVGGVAGGCAVNKLDLESGEESGDGGLTSAGSDSEGSGGESDGSSESDGGGETGDDSGPDGGDEPAACEEISARALAILGENCSQCHGPGSSGQAQFDYVTDVYAMVVNGQITPGEPDASPLFVRTENGTMPPASVEERPSVADIDTLWRWIADCVSVQFSCGQGEDFISTDDMLSWMRNDISDTTKISLEEREFIRYFTLSHLYNSGICAKELEVYRYGLFKLLNSLSTGNKVVIPKAIDSRGTIYRIDLRDYGWDADLWDEIVAANPFAIEYVKNEAADLKAFTRSKVPFQTGDWFVADGSRPPLYHDILRIPETRFELEDSFGIDVEANLDEEISFNGGLVARSAFQNSNVSVNNRLIERHEFPGASNRTYWLSYDFAGNAGCQNLFAEPLDFCEDGGEIIFSLPNGLQAYMLVDEFGFRIDEGPDDIVTDPEQPNQNVINGLSCMGCHAEGMIFKDDEVRTHVESSFDFTETEKQAVFNLHPLRDEFKALQDLDAKRFTDALEQIGPVVERDQEPVLRVFKAFDVDVDLRRAAAEFGVRVEQLSSQIGKLGPDLQKLVDGGTVKRQVFTVNFAQSVCDLNLGKTKRCL